MTEQIPIAKGVFMAGEIVHTNDYFVLLGDNTFALRSAHQTLAIMTRRRAGHRMLCLTSHDSFSEAADLLSKAKDELRNNRQKCLTLAGFENVPPPHPPKITPPPCLTGHCGHQRGVQLRRRGPRRCPRRLGRRERRRRPRAHGEPLFFRLRRG
jgi:hypothetical protein